MINYPVHNLKLTRSQLEGLYNFLKMVSDTETDNYFAAYFLMGISDFFRRRIWPKLAIEKPTYQLRLNSQDSFAIWLAFQSYGVGCIGQEWTPILMTIRDMFWTMDTTYSERLQPPQLNKHGRYS